MTEQWHRGQETEAEARRGPQRFGEAGRMHISCRASLLRHQAFPNSFSWYLASRSNTEPAFLLLSHPLTLNPISSPWQGQSKVHDFPFLQKQLWPGLHHSLVQGRTLSSPKQECRSISWFLKKLHHALSPCPGHHRGIIHRVSV